MKRIPTLLLGLFLVSSSLLRAEPVTVGSLNCYLFFEPSYHGNKVTLNGRPTALNFETKVSHLASFVDQVDIVGLQETEEGAVNDLAREAHENPFFVEGHDTYTGENTAIIFNAQRLQTENVGRVPMLDRLISKHTLLVAQIGHSQFLFLTVHLIRPIGGEAQKHRAQLDILSRWAQSEIDQNHNVVIVGDFNDSNAQLLGTGLTEVINEPTHLTHRQFDHIYTSPRIQVIKTAVVRPNYAKHPSDEQKTLWTDHYFVEAVLDIP